MTKFFNDYWAHALVVIAVMGVIVWGFLGGGNVSDKAYSAGALVADEKSYDFGKISMAAGKVSRKFILRNDGTDPVKIINVATSCMCTKANVTDGAGKVYGPFGMPGHADAGNKTSIEVLPGKEIELEAVFDPAAHGPAGVGLAQRSIFVETNSAKFPRIELKFYAVVEK